MRSGTGVVTHLYPYGVGLPLGPAVISEMTLEPGTYTKTYHWNGHTEADTGLGDPHGGARVAPGTYTLDAMWKGFDSTRATVDVLVAAPS